jgi:hypothetical protein
LILPYIKRPQYKRNRNWFNVRQCDRRDIYFSLGSGKVQCEICRSQPRRGHMGMGRNLWYSSLLSVFATLLLKAVQRLLARMCLRASWTKLTSWTGPLAVGLTELPATTLRCYLEGNPEVLDTMPPPELVGRYSG